MWAGWWEYRVATRPSPRGGATTDSGASCKMAGPTEPPNDSYRRGATAIYEQLNETSVAAAKVAAEYGKWLLQSLLLLNSGAIAGCRLSVTKLTAAPRDT